MFAMTYADAPEMAELGLIAPLGDILSQLSQGGGAKGINIDAVSPQPLAVHTLASMQLNQCLRQLASMQLNQCLRQLASDANILPQLQCISCMFEFSIMHDIAFHAADALLKSRGFGSRVRLPHRCCLTTDCFIARTGDYCSG